MATKVLITGGSGLVGTYLSDMLTSEGFEVWHLSRSIRGKRKYPTFQWDVKGGDLDEAALAVDHVIHLAGAGVADKRWSEKRKKLIHDSRIQSTALLKRAIEENNIKLKSFISASAIGLYGLDTQDLIVDEESKVGDDFLADVVRDWEAEAVKVESLGIPVVRLRIGVVLAREGGALPKMSLPVKFGLGAPLGSGEQYVSWIHIRDLCRIFRWSLEQSTSDVYNAVGPKPVTNTELNQQIAKTLKRPIFLPKVPEFALRKLFGEMASVVLGGNNVSSRKLEDAGFKFEFARVENALSDLFA